MGILSLFRRPLTIHPCEQCILGTRLDCFILFRKSLPVEAEEKSSLPISNLLPCARSSWFPLINALLSKTFLGTDSLPSLFWELLSQDSCTLNQEWKTHLVLHWTAERGTQNVAPHGKVLLHCGREPKHERRRRSRLFNYAQNPASRTQWKPARPVGDVLKAGRGAFLEKEGQKWGGSQSVLPAAPFSPAWMG